MPEAAGELQGQLLAPYDREYGRKCFGRLSRPARRAPIKRTDDAHRGVSGDEIGDEIGDDVSPGPGPS